MPQSDLVDIVAGQFRYVARLERALAPRTCAHFESLLPYADRIIHVRWSGEGCWIPMGDAHIALPWENTTRHPAPGQFILYPGGMSEVEILLAYGGVAFGSKAGPIAGNHFLTIIQGAESLNEMGKAVRYCGAQEIRFTAGNPGSLT